MIKLNKSCLHPREYFFNAMTIYRSSKQSENDEITKREKQNWIKRRVINANIFIEKYEFIGLVTSDTRLW